jgi:RHS repeat-associated protein
MGATTTSYLYDGIAPDSNIIQEQSGTTPTADLLTTPGSEQPNQPAVDTVPTIGTPGEILQLTTPSGENGSFLTDLRGSTIALANSSGQIATQYAYTPGGATTQSGAATANTFEFEGAQSDTTGWYLLGARYYNTSSESFSSQDPIGFASGETNLYRFAYNDPVDLTDPSGCGGCRPLNPAELAWLKKWAEKFAVDSLLTTVGIFVAAWPAAAAKQIIGSTAGSGAALTKIFEHQNQALAELSAIRTTAPCQ